MKIQHNFQPEKQNFIFQNGPEKPQDTQNEGAEKKAEKEADPKAIESSTVSKGGKIIEAAQERAQTPLDRAKEASKKRITLFDKATEKHAIRAFSKETGLSPEEIQKHFDLTLTKSKIFGNPVIKAKFTYKMTPVEKAKATAKAKEHIEKVDPKALEKARELIKGGKLNFLDLMLQIYPKNEAAYHVLADKSGLTLEQAKWYFELKSVEQDDVIFAPKFEERKR